MRARGLKRWIVRHPGDGTEVAPRAGAWIETLSPLAVNAVLRKSRPVRARGLKLYPMTLRKLIRLVAPRAGAWIETVNEFMSRAKELGRAPCGRVD